MLGINEEKLEVYPKDADGGGGAGMLWRRQKSASYDMSAIVDCYIVEKRSDEKWLFKIVYLSVGSSEQQQEYKKLDLEADSTSAIEIHSKLNHLINWQPSKTRDEYLAHREKKRQRRQTWHIGSYGKK